MPDFFSTATWMMLLLVGAEATAQSSATPLAMASAHRTVVLPESGQEDIPELAMAPGLVTTLFFGASLRVARAEVEERQLFSRMTVLEDALLLVPSPALMTGRKLRLRVSFVGGTRPASAEFLLVMDPSRTESHQVNVELRRHTAERCEGEFESEHVKTQQCQTELEQARQRPRGVTGLIAEGLLDKMGITTRTLVPGTGFVQRPEAPIQLSQVLLYRSAGGTAMQLTVRNVSGRPWMMAGAELVGEGGTRPRVTRVWQSEPLASGADSQQVVVETEVAATQAPGRFQLSLRQEGAEQSTVVEGVSLP